MKWRTLALSVLISPLGFAGGEDKMKTEAKAEAKAEVSTEMVEADHYEDKGKGKLEKIADNTKAQSERQIRVADGRDVVIKAADGNEILRITSKGSVSYKGNPIQAPNEIILAFYESVMSQEYAHANCLIRLNEFRQAFVKASTIPQTKETKK